MTAQVLAIVYIVGVRNCGSTLLDALLGAVPGAHSLGEAAGFYRYDPDRPCACMRPPSSCALCTTTLRALEAEGRLAGYRQRALQPLKERRFVWTVLSTRARTEYARDADVVFEAVAAATNSSVLIDSSKNVARAAALAHNSRHNIRVVHLVRDGRGYLRSRRSRARVDGRRYVPPIDMVGWLAKNVLISGLLARRLGCDRYLVVRYEDLMTDPTAVLAQIEAFAGLDTSSIGDRAITEGVERQHLFEPMRRTDYRRVQLDPSRLAAQRQTTFSNLRYWFFGGFLTALWGYDRRQTYLHPSATDRET